MEFQRERVYTALNADELHEGDKVIVANTLGTLKRNVANNVKPLILLEVIDEDYDLRFEVNFNKGRYALAYLVERKENCTNCGEGKWDVEHKKIYCDPVNCGNGNVVFRNHEIEVCEYWKPITKQKAEKDCDNCGQRCDGYGKGEVCSQWIPKAEKHTDYNHCEEAKKGYVCAMTNACPEKHYRPFKDTDELIKVWREKGGKWQKRELTMPLIWVRYKTNQCGQKGILITKYEKNYVQIEGDMIAMHAVMADYEFLDGSPCGVEVE